MITRLLGPVDSGLALAVVCYAAGYFGLKAVHEKLLANLLVAEVTAHLQSQ